MIDWLLSGGWILVCCVCGVLMPFQEPLPRRKPAPAPAKRTKQKAKGKGKKAKVAKPQKQKAEKPEAKKEWYKAQPMTAEQERMYFDYYYKSRTTR